MNNINWHHLNQIETNLARVLLNPELDLVARNAAKTTLEQHHTGNTEVQHVLAVFKNTQDTLTEKLPRFVNGRLLMPRRS
jgi:hypothetical protein